MDELTRRHFMKMAGLAGAACALGPIAAGCKSGFTRALAAESGAKFRTPKVAIDGVFSAKGEDPAAITRAAIEAAGGMSKFVKKGDIVVVKPNMGFDRKPEMAATTNPFVIAALVEMCLKAGAAKVRVFDRPCNDEKRCYKHSGVAEAAEKAGASVEFMKDSDYTVVKMPKTKLLKKWEINNNVMAADVFINVPIIKHHGETGITLGMKNLMGIAGGQRGAWHVGKIAQRIADVNSVVRPDLVVMDAYRILKDHGPTGGSLDDVRRLNTVAVATDIVAIDAYGAKLFGSDPSEVEYIVLANKMGLGEMDLKKVKLTEVKA